MTVASSRGTLTFACGRATPTIIAASATSDQRERQVAAPAAARGRRGSAAARVWRSAPRSASAAAATRRSRDGERDDASSASSAFGHWKLIGVRASSGRPPGRGAIRRVESTTWRTPTEASIAREPAALLGGRGGEARAQLRARACRRAAAGRSRGRRATARPRSAAPARAGRGSRPRATSWPPASWSSCFRQSAGRGSPRRRRRASAAVRPTPFARERLAERRRAVLRLALGAQRAQQRRAGRRGPGAAAACTLCSPPNVSDAEPVAAPRGDVPDRERDALGDVRLAPVGGAELHRRRRVEHEPGDEHALGEVDADVRLAGPGGHVPVDPAHVVAGLVRPHLRQLGARPRAPRSGSRPRAGRPSCGRSGCRAHAAAHPASAPGPGSGVGSPSADRGRSARYAAFIRARSMRGTGTFWITASRIVSGLISSASAW